MNIAQSLKEKNRILSGIKKIKDKITKNNQCEVGAERAYDVNDLVIKLTEEQTKLVAIKAGIHNASEPVRTKIFEMSEMKDMD